MNRERDYFVIRRFVFLVKPAAVKIVLGEDEIQAGSPMSARCETWGSSPAARIVWRLGGLVIRDSSLTTTQRSNSTVSKIALVLGKDDDGKELACRAENPRFPGGVLERSRIIRVSCKISFFNINSQLLLKCMIKYKRKYEDRDTSFDFVKSGRHVTVSTYGGF